MGNPTRVQRHFLAKLQRAQTDDGRKFTSFREEEDAIIALALDPHPSAWMPWEESDAVDGQWFFFRERDDSLHVDQVGTTNGKIDAKYGCGLDFYEECQQVRFQPKVGELVAGIYGVTT